MGKPLEHFPMRPDQIGTESVPLLFQLLAGYFRSNQSAMRTTGIFRVTGSDKKVRELELHLSRGNYAFLAQVNDPHVVVGYWKRVLRELKQPLVPFEVYNMFANVDETTELCRTSDE